LEFPRQKAVTSINAHDRSSGIICLPVERAKLFASE
jgi:hypothetical protein